MNRYSMICRLRWPAFLLLTGVIALLDQVGAVSWGRAWPLYLILWGALALAERAALASQPPTPGFNPNQGYAPGYTPGYAPPPGTYANSYPGPYPGSHPGPAASANPIPPAPASIVPTGPEPDISSPEPQPRKSWEQEGR